MKTWLQSFYGRVLERTPDITAMDLSEQRVLISRIADDHAYADDLFMRSYCQYLAQAHGKATWLRIALALASMLILLPLVIGLYINGRRSRATLRANAVRFFSGEGLMPSALDSCATVCAVNGHYLRWTDVCFILSLWCRFPFAWFMVAKIAYKVSHYRANIDAYRPSALFVTLEYSFTSSALTRFCRENQVEHINVMHGEKLFYAGDGFFQFDRCYVWDAHYVELFRALRAEPNQFATSLPVKLAALVEDASQYEVQDVVTYFLDNDSPEFLRTLDAALAKAFSGSRVFLRPHPIFSDRARVEECVRLAELEPVGLPLAASIGRSRYVVSRFSTVLLEAIFAGRDVVIDDVTSDVYARLEAADYIVLSKPHMRLSELMEGGRRCLA